MCNRPATARRGRGNARRPAIVTLSRLARKAWQIETVRRLTRMKLSLASPVSQCEKVPGPRNIPSWWHTASTALSFWSKMSSQTGPQVLPSSEASRMPAVLMEGLSAFVSRRPRMGGGGGQRAPWPQIRKTDSAVPQFDCSAPTAEHCPRVCSDPEHCTSSRLNPWCGLSPTAPPAGKAPGGDESALQCIPPLKPNWRQATSAALLLASK